jgi:hypothetical protein
MKKIIIVLVSVCLLLFSCSDSYRITIKEIRGDTKNVTVIVNTPYYTTKEQDIKYINSLYPGDRIEYIVSHLGCYSYYLVVNRNDVPNLIHGDN